MMVSPGSPITQHFATLTDPRIDHTKRHQLLDILTIALCAIICGADEWVAMASEYRAIAVLPGAEDAVTWEPEPGRVYSWGTALVA